jgi:hypothetical protein
MSWHTRLFFRPVAGVILLIGVAAPPLLLPGYDQVRQTVSEIGETDSPARIPFAAMPYLVALTLAYQIISARRKLWGNSLLRLCGNGGSVSSSFVT